MDQIVYEPRSFYVFDKTYLDFERLFIIHESKSFFVIRAKNNLQFKRQYSATVDKRMGVQCDQTGELKGFYSAKDYPEKIRRIKFYDEEQNRTFIFLTNNLNLASEEIACLYKHRWKVELFFKWIKQHLKIKSFWGTTENAVKTQVYIAVITYTLVAIIRQRLKTAYSTYEVLQILGSSLLDKTPINQPLKKTSDQDVKEFSYNQLKIWKFKRDATHNNLMIIHDASFIWGKGYAKFAMQMNGGEVPSISGTLLNNEKKYAADFLFDMGATGCLFLNQGFLKKNNLYDTMDTIGEAQTAGAGSGVTKTTRALLPVFILGNYNF
jgi:hypothetical protein